MADITTELTLEVVGPIPQLILPLEGFELALKHSLKEPLSIPTNIGPWSSSADAYGVGFLSSFPIRPIAVGWDRELWQTSRIHAAHFLVNQTWVTGGVAYGWAYQSESLQVKADIERLLQQLTAQVLVHPGPKFICADFTQHPGAMKEPKVWESQGWIEIQDWAYRRHHLIPAHTWDGHYQKRRFVLVTGVASVIKGLRYW